MSFFGVTMIVAADLLVVICLVLVIFICKPMRILSHALSCDLLVIAFGHLCHAACKSGLWSR